MRPSIRVEGLPLTDLITAIGLALAIEGAIYALFPVQMKKLIAAALASDDASMRLAGLFAVFLGVVIVWLIRG